MYYTYSKDFDIETENLDEVLEVISTSKKIEKLCDSDPNTKLVFAIVEQAVKDGDKEFFLSDMFDSYMELAGIKANVARHMILKYMSQGKSISKG